MKCLFRPPGISDKLHGVPAWCRRDSGIQNNANSPRFASFKGNVPDARHEGMFSPNLVVDPHHTSFFIYFLYVLEFLNNLLKLLWWPCFFLFLNFILIIITNYWHQTFYAVNPLFLLNYWQLCRFQNEYYLNFI